VAMSTGMYTPSFVYRCSGFCTVSVVLSPKSQSQPVGRFSERSWNWTIPEQVAVVLCENAASGGICNEVHSKRMFGRSVAVTRLPVLAMHTFALFVLRTTVLLNGVMVRKCTAL